MLRAFIFLLPLLVSACTQADPCRVSFNYATDLLGPMDTRKDTWGSAAAYSWNVPIAAPAGARIRVVRLSGDLVSWVRDPVPETVKTGVLFGIQTTAPEGTKLCADPRMCADNTLLYVQDAISGNGNARTPFAETFPGLGARLETDGVLVVKVAAWLNDTGKPVHLEATATVFYYFDYAEIACLTPRVCPVAGR